MNELLKRHLTTIILLLVAGGIFAAIVVLYVYRLNFGGEISLSNTDWGTFGDFIGGTLNPLFSFLALIALLLTIVLQTAELRATTEELRFTRASHEKSQEALKSQAKTLENQLEEAKKAANAEFFFKAIDLIQSKEMRLARRELFELVLDRKEPFQHWDDDEIFNAEHVAQCFDIVGMMVRSGVIEERLLLSSWQSPIKKSWECVEELARHRRAKDHREIWDDFEWLYEKVKEYK